MATHKSAFTPMRHQRTFDDVLHNMDDQVIVRELLIKMVPVATKQEIVEEFNAHADRYNARIST
jgi:hypothetical protein